ncbi:ankyrin repeat domain-containing protein 13D [Pieris rapae]|uniref:ankyrin repeat domain-containing protein 13D n=1 Tax=Pieris rapae TaxID=64459 RepID=UPI001E27CC44|nr:ankyrin repeat domain-containing protein 13D [Pieris rapae]
MPMSADEVSEKFPVHWLVWNDNYEELRIALNNKKWSSEELESHDPRGRTPLLLAVTLGHHECVRALLAAGANVCCDRDGWTAVQEATARGHIGLLAAVLARRDHARHAARVAALPALLRRLSLAPDFYVEMKWEFTSWIPLVSRICPFDTYRVYKRGANVRVDTTLLGFHDNRWERGDRTYIFSGQGDSAKLLELDHIAGTVWTERVEGSVSADDWPLPQASHLNHRLRTPVHINYLDTDKICFERSKSGIWGWRQDKMENVNGYECKVFGANNVEIVSKTRWEHVPRSERRAVRAPPLAGLLAAADDEGAPPPPPPDREDVADMPDLNPSWEQYFDEGVEECEIGRPREITSKVQKFRATLWLCEDYPLELQEQIMPILDLMASISSPHFVKLKDFIQLQLPSGFPVKIEIPLFHVINARISFGNIFARDTSVRYVECVPEGDRLTCLIDDACFAIGRGYREAGPVSEDRIASIADDDEELLHYAIQQSLMEAGTQRDQVDVWEALRGARPVTPSPPAPVSNVTLDEDLEQTMLQRAIAESLRIAAGAVDEEKEESPEAENVEVEDELKAALALSAAEHEARRAEIRDEEKALDEVLRLSMNDK